MLGDIATAAPQGPPPLTDNDIALYQSASEDMRVHALIAFARAGQQEQAAELLQRFPLTGPHAANRTLFIEGLILKGRHDLFGAARKFRSALADDPKLTLVRSELAQVLVELDENDSAAHHLRLLEADAPNAADAAGIRTFIDKIDAKKPYAFSGYVSVAPSTNVNSGSNHSILSSDVFGPGFDPNGIITNQKQSGLGFSGGLSAGFSKKLNDRFQLVLGSGVNVNIYTDPQYNSASISESAELRYMFTDGYFGFGGTASQNIAQPSLTSFEIGSHAYGPRVTASYQITQRDLINSSVSYEWRDYPYNGSLNRTSLHTDLAVTHAIDSTANFTVFGGYDHVSNQDLAKAYSTYFGGVNVYKEFPFGLTVNANAQTRISPFEAPDIFTSTTRFDTRYIGSMTLTKRDFNFMGFAPSFNYTYTLNKSNVALFDYDSHAVNVSLTKDF